MILDNASMEKMDNFSKLSPQHEACFTQIDNPSGIKVQKVRINQNKYKKISKILRNHSIPSRKSH